MERELLGIAAGVLFILVLALGLLVLVHRGGKFR